MPARRCWRRRRAKRWPRRKPVRPPRRPPWRRYSQATCACHIFHTPCASRSATKSRARSWPRQKRAAGRRRMKHRPGPSASASKAMCARATNRVTTTWPTAISRSTGARSTAAAATTSIRTPTWPCRRCSTRAKTASTCCARVPAWASWPTFPTARKRASAWPAATTTAPCPPRKPSVVAWARKTSGWTRPGCRTSPLPG